MEILYFPSWYKTFTGFIKNFLINVSCLEFAIGELIKIYIKRISVNSKEKIRYYLLYRMSTNIQTSQKTRDNPKTKLIIPLLLKQYYKGELMDFYYTEALNDDKKDNYHHIIKDILDDFIKDGIIEKIKNVPSKHKGRVYHKINWLNFINFYLNQHFKILDKKDQITLNQEEINFLVKFCKKHKKLIFGKYKKFKDILINQSVWGFFTFSLLILYLSLKNNFKRNNNFKDILEDVILQTLTYSFTQERVTDYNNPIKNEDYFPYNKINDIDYETTVLSVIKSIRQKIRGLSKRDKNDFKKFKKLFIKIYPDPRLIDKKALGEDIIERVINSNKSVSRVFK